MNKEFFPPRPESRPEAHSGDSPQIAQVKAAVIAVRTGQLNEENRSLDFKIRPELPLSGIDWVIVGGESGPRCRTVQIEWVRSLRDQCIKKDVPFFFKQWGGMRKKTSGRLLDGRAWSEMPEARNIRSDHRLVCNL